MAEAQIRVPGIGDVPRTYVYMAGALVVGIVGYAWWTGRGVDAVDEYPIDEGDIGQSDDAYINPAPGGSTVESEPVDPESLPPTTNAEWTRRAVAYLESLGYNPVTVATAVGKYLSRKVLSAQQADIVRTAVAAAGPVPNGTYFILTSSTPDPDPPKKKPPAKKRPPIPRHRTLTLKKGQTLSQLVSAYNRKYKTNYSVAQIRAFNLRHRKDEAVKENRYFWFPVRTRDIGK